MLIESIEDLCDRVTAIEGDPVVGLEHWQEDGVTFQLEPKVAGYDLGSVGNEVGSIRLLGQVGLGTDFYGDAAISIDKTSDSDPILSLGKFSQRFELYQGAHGGANSLDLFLRAQDFGFGEVDILTILYDMNLRVGVGISPECALHLGGGEVRIENPTGIAYTRCKGGESPGGLASDYSSGVFHGGAVSQWEVWDHIEGRYACRYVDDGAIGWEFYTDDFARLTVGDAGRVGINCTPEEADLDIRGAEGGAEKAAEIYATRNSLTIIANDELGIYGFTGLDGGGGSATQMGAKIAGIATAAWAAADSPARLEISTTPVGSATPVLAITVDDSQDTYFTGQVHRGVNAGITADVVQAQGQAPLTADINEVATVANTNDAVTLPTAAAGLEVVVMNNGANTLQIFPATGDNLGAGLNNPTTLAAGGNVRYVAYNATNWEAMEAI